MATTDITVPADGGIAIVTEDDLKQAKLRRLVLQERLKRLDVMIGWTVSKIVGIAGVSIGLCEWLAPDLIQIVHLSEPKVLLGASLALLFGRQLINPFKKAIAGDAD